ncbi:MAG: diaminopimelate decarboxylase [Muribaculaceae bacterium]|nr:diaminopimelate decarboxylase [Muribaculaceae bacterium]
MSTLPFELFKASSTPVYYYDIELLQHTLEALVKASSVDHRFKVHYAVKANARPEILRIIQTAGLGADCVSGGEIKEALTAGFPSDRIVFAGVGKTDKEILLGLSHEIECFNVESTAELTVINDLALKAGAVANVALRVNPEIDAHTHKYITTGLSENKFGIAMSQLDEAVGMAQEMAGINLVGLHFHIGSQLTQLDSYRLLCGRINELVSLYESKGVKFKLINVGGGLGIDYDNPDEAPIPDFKNYFNLFKENLDLDNNIEIHFELGRAVVAQCGSLITRVLYIKESPTRRFAIVDAGMTDLIRPALYQAHHAIQLVSEDASERPVTTYDVVGPICESSDVFATDESLPRLCRGDILAIRSAGAYGEIMASQYNLRKLPGAIFNNQ